MKSIIAVSILGVVAGCATDPAPNSDSQALARSFEPVEAHQINDLQLGCADLTTEINSTDEAIATLDKQIARQEGNTSALSLASAFAGVSGAFANNPFSARMASAEQTIAAPALAYRQIRRSTLRILGRRIKTVMRPLCSSTTRKTAGPLAKRTPGHLIPLNGGTVTLDARDNTSVAHPFRAPSTVLASRAIRWPGSSNGLLGTGQYISYIRRPDVRILLRDEGGTNCYAGWEHPIDIARRHSLNEGTSTKLKR